MENIDKLTLELLTNKRCYHRYLYKTDPKQYNEHQLYLKKIQKYKKRITDMTLNFLENPDIQINYEMNEMFSIYSKTFIKYFEMKELEKNGGCYETNDADSDSDILFDNENDTHTTSIYGEDEGENDDTENILQDIEETNEKTNENMNEKKETKSYWTNERVIKKNHDVKPASFYKMDMYVTRK